MSINAEWLLGEQNEGQIWTQHSYYWLRLLLKSVLPSVWTELTQPEDLTTHYWCENHLVRAAIAFTFKIAFSPQKSDFCHWNHIFFDKNETSYLDWKVVCVKQQLRFKLKTQFHKYLNSIFSWKLCFNNMKTTYSAWNYCIKCQKECFCRMESVIYALNCSLYKA